MRDVVGPLEEGAQPHEVPAFVVRERRVGQPLDELRLVAHTLEERVRIPLGDLGQRRIAQEEMQRVERLPHLARDALTHLSRRCPRALDARDDRTWIVLVKGQPLPHRARRFTLLGDLGEQ